jgi:hypothetical protein
MTSKLTNDLEISHCDSIASFAWFTGNSDYGRVMFHVTCTVPVTPLTESVSGAG